MQVRHQLLQLYSLYSPRLSRIRIRGTQPQPFLLRIQLPPLPPLRQLIPSTALRQPLRQPLRQQPRQQLRQQLRQQQLLLPLQPLQFYPTFLNSAEITSERPKQRQTPMKRVSYRSIIHSKRLIRKKQSKNMFHFLCTAMIMI